MDPLSLYTLNMEQELTKKGTVRKRKPKQKIYYFTKETEEAILEYVASDDDRHKNKLYREKIDYALFKLTQNIINTYKFPYMDGSTEDKQQEVLFHLLKSLHLYQQSKGAAYSYFGTAALRYCINVNTAAYRKLKMMNHIDDDEEKTQIIDYSDNLSSDDYHLDDDFYVINMFIKYMDIHIDVTFTDEEEKKIALAIIGLFERREYIEIFNKKAILLYIRELTNRETQDITKISNKLKKIYTRLNNQYMEFGFISLNF